MAGINVRVLRTLIDGPPPFRNTRCAWRCRPCSTASTQRGTTRASLGRLLPHKYHMWVRLPSGIRLSFGASGLRTFSFSSFLGSGGVGGGWQSMSNAPAITAMTVQSICLSSVLRPSWWDLRTHRRRYAVQHQSNKGCGSRVSRSTASLHKEWTCYRRDVYNENSISSSRFSFGWFRYGTRGEV